MSEINLDEIDDDGNEIVADADVNTDDDSQPDDFSTMFGDMLGGVNYKFYIILAIILLFILSDFYVDKMLSRFGGAVLHKNMTAKGATITVILSIMLMMTVDVLISARVI